MTNATNFYATFPSDPDDLRTVDELIVHANYDRACEGRMRRRPAGVFLTNTPEPPNAYEPWTGPAQYIQIKLTAPIETLPFWDSQTKLGSDRAIWKKLTHLTRDLPIEKIGKNDTIADVAHTLCQSLGSMSCTRLMATAGIAGIVYQDRPYLISTDVVDQAKLNGRHLGRSASLWCPPTQQQKHPRLPTSQTELDADYALRDALSLTNATVFDYVSRQDPNDHIVVKQEGTSEATLEGLIAFRLARAMGAVTPDMTCFLNQKKIPTLAIEYIHGAQLNHLKHQNISSMRKIQIEQRLEMGNLCWMLMDHVDMNEANFHVDLSTDSACMIDAGGALRCEPWGHSKDPRGTHQNWYDPSPAEALFCPRKTRYTMAASIQDRARAINQIAARKTDIQQALIAVGKEIAGLAAEGGQFRHDGYTPEALQTEIGAPLIRRIEMAQKILNDQTILGAPTTPPAPERRLWERAQNWLHQTFIKQDKALA